MVPEESDKLTTFVITGNSISKQFFITEAREITYNNFEISFVVFMPNITTNHAITYTNTRKFGRRVHTEINDVF